MGVDAPKPPRASRATLDTVRRRQISNLYRPAPGQRHHAPPQQAGHFGPAGGGGGTGGHVAPAPRPGAGSARAAAAGPRPRGKPVSG